MIASRRGSTKSSPWTTRWRSAVGRSTGGFLEERFGAVYSAKVGDPPPPTLLMALLSYDAEDFVNQLRSMNATPHVAQSTKRPLVGDRRRQHATRRIAVSQRTESAMNAPAGRLPSSFVSGGSARRHNKQIHSVYCS